MKNHQIEVFKKEEEEKQRESEIEFPEPIMPDGLNQLDMSYDNANTSVSLDTRQLSLNEIMMAFQQQPQTQARQPNFSDYDTSIVDNNSVLSQSDDNLIKIYVVDCERVVN
jgi:hypothetical protein